MLWGKIKYIYTQTYIYQLAPSSGVSTIYAIWEICRLLFRFFYMLCNMLWYSTGQGIKFRCKKNPLHTPNSLILIHNIMLFHSKLHFKKNTDTERCMYIHMNIYWQEEKNPPFRHSYTCKTQLQFNYYFLFYSSVPLSHASRKIYHSLKEATWKHANDEKKKPNLLFKV